VPEGFQQRDSQVFEEDGRGGEEKRQEVTADLPDELMTSAKTTLRQAARWLVVMLTSLVVLQGNVFATRTTAPKSSCAESCDRRCPCCISKSTPANSSAPLAPASSTRVAVEKDFQFVPMLAVLLTPACEACLTFIVSDFSVSLRSQAPLYQRHCVYLL
jgi:hypothetical protein